MQPLAAHQNWRDVQPSHAQGSHDNGVQYWDTCYSNVANETVSEAVAAFIHVRVQNGDPPTVPKEHQDHCSYAK